MIPNPRCPRPQGYRGLIEGGSNIRQMTWEDVDGILPRGGTVIGTARSDMFRKPEGRRLAARHLIERGITDLIVIGGDGSLTGANIFKKEWAGHVAALLEHGANTALFCLQRE